MPGGITGRPTRALTVLGALLLGWVAGRWPLFEREVAGAVARAQAVQLAAAAPAAKAAPVQLAALPPRAFPPVPDAVVVPFAAPLVSRAAAVEARPRRDRIRTVRERPLEVGWTLPPGVRRPAAAVVVPRRSSSADDLATAAYTALAAGDRRAAARGFADAVAADPSDPRVPAWTAQRRLLTRRWSGGAYVFARAAGSANPGAAPLLGGGQSGAGIAWTPDPLARRPLSLTARATSANDGSNAEAAFGLRWQPVRGVSLSAERLVALAPGGRNDWTVRLAGGAAASRGRIEGAVYGETGVVGIERRTVYAAAQARAGYRLPPVRTISLVPSAGVWASLQDDGTMIDRVDVGPGVLFRWDRAPLPLDVAVDYRFRVTGNAAPRSGVAVTLSTAF